VVVLTCACGSQEPPILSLSLSAQPRSIDDRGQATTLSVMVSDDRGVTRGGPVDLRAAAGQLGDGGTEFTVGLDDAGTGRVPFTCRRALDARCAGSVRLAAHWAQGRDFLDTVLRVPVSTSDGGLPDGGP
jgi:hypothetical protein